MSEAKTLPDYLKGLQAATSESLSILVMDSNGNLMKVSPYQLNSYLMIVGGSHVTDLNEVTNPGLYALNGNSSPKNGPEGVNLMLGMLEVYYRGGTTGQLYQRVIGRNGETATRTYNYGEWHPWHIQG